MFSTATFSRAGACLPLALVGTLALAAPPRLAQTIPEPSAQGLALPTIGRSPYAGLSDPGSGRTCVVGPTSCPLAYQVPLGRPCACPGGSGYVVP